MADATSKPLLLYDGLCPFCTAQAARLERLTGGRVEARPLQDGGLLARVGLSEDEAMRELKLVVGGRIYGGAEAAVRALELGRPGLTPLLRAYYLPFLRPLADRAYGWMAGRRYTFWGRREACEGGCGLAAPTTERASKKR